MGFGVSVGLVLALVAGLSQIGDDLVGSTMEVLRAIPVVALMPLAILWFGVDEQPKIILLVIGVTFPVYVNTHAAIRGIDARLVDMASTFGVGRLGLIRRVILPGALPGFTVGLRFALTGAWLYLVFVEQLNTREGLGALMNNARTWGRTDIVMLCLVIYGALGFGADAAVRLIERRVLGWRRTLAER